MPIHALAFYMPILSVYVFMSAHWFKTRFLLLSVFSLHRPCEDNINLAKAGEEWFSAYEEQPTGPSGILKYYGAFPHL